MHFRVFFKVKVQNQGFIFWGCQNFKNNFGVVEIPDIFFFGVGGGGGWGWTVDAGPEPTYEGKMRVPPDPLGVE